ncbi:unnamed protein product [Caenorhabditis brenneri]
MSSGNIVELNIGGVIFQTTKSTLMKFDAFFKTMLETDIPLDTDKNGAIFVDRDPKHFRSILNFMRDGSVDISDLKADIQEIQTEAQYYLLDDLVELCAARLDIMTSGNIVELNIGGTAFQTTKSTLTTFDGFFKTMLETGVPLEKDETGAIFIDRSPKHFELILNYMRDGSVNIPDSKSDIQEIQTEAQYYLLDGLVELCKSKIPDELPVKLPIIESDAHLLNLIASSETTGKPVVVIYYHIDGYDSAFEMTNVSLGGLMQNYKDEFDIWFKPSNNETRRGSEYRIFSNNKRYELHGYLRGIYEALNNYGKRGKYDNLYDDYDDY